MEKRTAVFIDCPFCIDGEKAVGVECPHCSGEGLIQWGAQVLEGKIFPTYKIVEATLGSEFNALSDANKDAYRQILSCGIVDLTSGTSIRTTLWEMFDENSDTRAALITLLDE